MKFTCLKENLVKSLNIVTKAVPIKGPLPILTNILIKVEDGRIQFSGTNLETTISTYVGGSVESEGSITVPAKTFRDFVANLSDEKVTAELEKDTLKVTSGKARAKINGLSASDFPPLPQFIEDTADCLKISSREFSNAVSLVAFAAALDETRPIYSGILFDYSSVNKTLTLVSTNGYRLSEKVISLESNYPSFTAVLPAKTVSEVSRIFAPSEDVIEFMLNSNENLALFQSNNVLVATRVIDGSYPNYKSIIPSTKVVTVEITSAHLLEATKLAGVFAKDSADSLLIKIDTEKSILSISAISQEMGDHVSDIEVVVEGDSLDIAFHPKYLLDLLSNVKVDKLLIETGGSLKPCVVRPVDDTTFMHLIMPLTISN